MAPYYDRICTELSWKKDDNLAKQMKINNEKKLKEIEDKIADAEQNLGSIEVREAYFDKFNYLCRIGDKVRLRVSDWLSRRNIHVVRLLGITWRLSFCIGRLRDCVPCLLREDRRKR